MKSENNTFMKINREHSNKRIITNPVKNRFLPLSDAVLLGLEPEPKKTDFIIKREIGSGSFGRVYLASHIKTKVDYAIKVIDKRNKTNIDGKPYFHREIEIMSKIRHPNCVRLFGNFEDENFCYFIMEYIPGGNLYSLMSKYRAIGLNIYLVARILRELASAIFYLHNMNPPIIHRDIKPENILLMENNSVKLTDFGWSNYIDFEGEQRLTLCGTPIYLAPEMIQNLGHDKHVDIWCLGVLLFELLTGKPPFYGQDKIRLMQNIVNVNIVWPSTPRINLDPDAKDLIIKILKKNPKERISLENMIKHNFFIKYCPNIKPYFDKKQKFHSKPFIISKDIPNENDYELDNNSNDNSFNNDFSDSDKKYFYKNNTINNENKEKIEKNGKKKKPLDIRHLFRTSQKKNKIREVTPEPPSTKLCLEKKRKMTSNDFMNNNNNISRQYTKTQIKIYTNNTFRKNNNNNETNDNINISNNHELIEKIKKLIKEKEKYEKEIEDFKLREIGYNKKIEELTISLNNINQENILLKMDLEKKKKEINKLRSSRNLNLNLNNQTTYNINTSIDNIRSNNYKEIDMNNSRKNNVRTFISKTPENLLRRGKRIIVNKNRPYLKKNAILNNNKSGTTDDFLKKDEINSEINNINKKTVFTEMNGIRNKNIKYDNYSNMNNSNLDISYNTELKDKENYKILIKHLQRENENLQKENGKYQNKHKIGNLNKQNFDDLV